MTEKFDPGRFFNGCTTSRSQGTPVKLRHVDMPVPPGTHNNRANLSTSPAVWYAILGTQFTLFLPKFPSAAVGTPPPVCGHNRLLLRDETHICCTPLSYPSPHKITNSDFSDAKVVQQLADAWFNTPACETLNKRLGSANPAPVVPGIKPGCLSYLRQLRALIARTTLNGIRDPATYALRYRKGCAVLDICGCVIISYMFCAGTHH